MLPVKGQSHKILTMLHVPCVSYVQSCIRSGSPNCQYCMSVYAVVHNNVAKVAAMLRNNNSESVQLFHKS